MQRLHIEYLLKGIFLGLILFLGLQEADWRAFGLANLLLAGIVGISLVIGVAIKTREGYRIGAKPFTFLLFLFLESPTLVYGGILVGLIAATAVTRTAGSDGWLVGCTLGGGVVGLAFAWLRDVRGRNYRIGLGLLLAALMVSTLLLTLGMLGEILAAYRLPTRADPNLLGAQLLVALPLFALLIFAGEAEETEVEIGTLAALLALGVALAAPARSAVQTTGYVLAVIFYLWYTLRVLSRMRVFKHSIRGITYTQAQRYRDAIRAFRRALQIDSTDALAREGLWKVHRSIDFARLPADSEILSVVDVDMCLERAASLLMEPPTPDKLEESRRLLELVIRQRPAMKAPVHYWRAVACTHSRQIDDAVVELENVLDPTHYLPNDPARRGILFSAWQLALRAHPELTARVGNTQLAIPGRRMEAIAAVEARLAANPEDAEAAGFKRILYHDLTEAEYVAAAGPTGTATVFDHVYVHQLGMALLSDPDRWQRGAEYLRMAVRGLPQQGPLIFVHIAQVCQRNGQGEAAWRNYELAKQAGRQVGVKNLAADESQAYFVAVKILAEAARMHNMTEMAIENYHCYAESPSSGIETLRTLAALYEIKGDPLAALRVTEQALIYNAQDKDLLERKDRYYYSVLPDDLRARLDMIRNGFDVSYCVKKARALLDAKNWDLDTLDWSQHLVELVRIVQPENLAARFLLARALMRRGEKEQAVTILQELYSGRPERFATHDDEDAWYLACKLLGETYLYELSRPDLAIECFKRFRESTKSGADTIYKLGQAYEQLGDVPKAVKFYKNVVSYESHPLAPDARDALHRLQAS